MLARLRPRLTYANVMSSIAVFLALGGGAAYAANTVFSTDIVDGEVKTLDLASTAVTNAKLGWNSVSGGKVIDDNLTGTDIAEYTLTKVPSATTADLPGGRTIRGTFGLHGVFASADDRDGTQIAFGFTLASAPQGHFVPAGTLKPIQCPGDAVNPTAQAGHLCVYESFNNNINDAESVVFDPVFGSTGSSRWGAVLHIGATAAGAYTSRGTWAVRAP